MSSSSTSTPNFSAADTNNDGNVSRSEWDAYFSKSGSSSGSTSSPSSSSSTPSSASGSTGSSSSTYGSGSSSTTK
jgi:hypothetical protein